MSRKALTVITVFLACTAFAQLTLAQPARANLLGTGCSVIGTIGEGWMGKACNVAVHAKQAVGTVGKVLGLAAKHVLSPSGAIGIAAIVAWAVGGAHFVLTETATLIGQSSSPELTAAWFSSVYWRVAMIAAMLTMPFLCAAAVHAVLRADLALLARAALGYLPLSFLAVAIAAPLTMLLLQVTDWMGASVAQATGSQGGHFLALAGGAIGVVGLAIRSPFVTFLIAVLTAAGGLVLWLELLVREAAVYVVVLMLPLVFAAMVWPARRVWAIRAVEVLAALIVAKFAIVAVLALAGAALEHAGGNVVVKSLAGLVLVILGAFSPWVLLRLLPLAELASAAAGHVREHAQSRVGNDARLGKRGLSTIGDNVAALMSHMQGYRLDAIEAATGPRPALQPDDAQQETSPRSESGAAAPARQAPTAVAREAAEASVPAPRRSGSLGPQVAGAQPRNQPRQQDAAVEDRPGERRSGRDEPDVSQATEPPIVPPPPTLDGEPDDE